MEILKLESPKRFEFDGPVNGFIGDITETYVRREAKYEGKKIIFYIYEDYSFLTNSGLTVTFITYESDKKSSIEIIVSGEKIGIMGFGYGVAKRYCNKVFDTFRQYGFTEKQY